MLLPLDAHCTQSERFRKQAKITLPVQKRIWQRIVRSKIKSQSVVLRRLTGDDRGLSTLAARVASGDNGNLEAQAAQRYWLVVFNNPHFRRNQEADDQNRLLNYGYAILRAATARAICAAGLHPSLGVHHHNRYDAFCLASDLMEPFRPLVDETVAKIVFEHGEYVCMGKEVKKAIINGVVKDIETGSETRSLFSVLLKSASSLASVYGGERKNLYLPEWGK